MVQKLCGPLPPLFPYAKSEAVVINFHCAWEGSFTNNYGIMGYDYGTNWYHNEDILKGYVYVDSLWHYGKYYGG